MDEGPWTLCYTSCSTSTSRGLRGTYKPRHLRPRGQVDNRRYNKAELYYSGAYSRKAGVEKTRKSLDGKKGKIIAYYRYIVRRDNKYAI